MCHARTRLLARLSTRIVAPSATVDAHFDAPCALLADAAALLLARVVSASGPTLLTAFRRGSDEGVAVWLEAAALTARRLVPDAMLLVAAVVVFAAAMPRGRAHLAGLAVTAWSRWVTVLMAEALWNAVRGGEPLGAVHRVVQAAAFGAAAASIVAIVRSPHVDAPSRVAGRSPGALFTLALGALAAAQVANAAPMLTAPRGPSLGEAAPDLTVPLLDGGAFHLEAARGRPVLVDFWATWCGTCVASMPALDALHARARERVEVIAVEVEGARSEADRLAGEGRWSFPIGLGDAALAARYGVRVLPHLVLVDARGRVALVVRGAYDEAALERAVGKLEP